MPRQRACSIRPARRKGSGSGLEDLPDRRACLDDADQQNAQHGAADELTDAHGDASDEETCRRLIRAAEQVGIAWQGEARNRDMSGAIEAMSAGSRPGVGWLGVPVRNAGPFEAVYSMDEVSRCGQVLEALCRKE